MVSLKRRRAGLKARETCLQRRRREARPGFGQRLWTDGHPADKNKFLWKKIDAEIDRSRYTSPEYIRLFAAAAIEGRRVKRARLKRKLELSEEKELNRERERKAEAQRQDKQSGSGGKAEEFEPDGEAEISGRDEEADDKDV
ncbi:hypothetical protein TWF730_010440 [Orbilia blumenaviensis]|uniref:Uncharacterized protein n=1 Tax=Orbilia blumenaviensis TaxID=1796055 RepID=A0AAV9US04_9PEZI